MSESDPSIDFTSKTESETESGGSTEASTEGQPELETIGPSGGQVNTEEVDTIDEEVD